MNKSAKVVLVGGTRQQRNLLIIPNPPQTDINADAGVIQARRRCSAKESDYRASSAAARAASGHAAAAPPSSAMYSRRVIR
jgi:hypothetical protein